MKKLQGLKSVLVGGASVLAMAHPAAARMFDIPDGDLSTALVAYMKQSDVDLVYVDNIVRGHKSHGVRGDLTETAALTQILSGTGFAAQTMPMNAIGIVPQHPKPAERLAQAERKPAAAAPPQQSGLETVVVTAQHKSEDIQQVPIAVTALSQQQLTERQIAGGPDLVKEVPNLTFSKTNFTGYNLEIRGIGTQAISVTTDPAVAVAFNDIPFIRNHFFEQEFYDLQDVEVLRGPQGTLYGRNATAGVVNVKSALPTDQYEAMTSADLGNYSNRRLEGMLNIPIVGDTLDLRIAGEWTKRDGYTTNELTNSPVDGRDLWSGRATLGWKPSSDLQVDLVWEHFSEDDDRMRTAKQLCETDPIPSEVGGYPVESGHTNTEYEPSHFLSQGCSPASLYSKNSFEVPNGLSLPYYDGIGGYAPLQSNDLVSFDPYATTTQSTNLRVIQTTLNPTYKAKNDTLELNGDYSITPSLTLTSQTGYNHDFLWSTEDYNRFDTAEGAFQYTTPNPGGTGSNDLQLLTPDPNGLGHCRSANADACTGLTAGASCVPLAAAYANTGHYACVPDGVFCDPQLGCSDRLVAEDLSEEHAWQFSQELRLASHFSGPLNFSVGGNYLHYETEENYYVFINTVTAAAYNWTTFATSPERGQTQPWVPGVSDNANCVTGGYAVTNPYNPPTNINNDQGCIYIDPNPIGSLNNEGHNYFLSQNPYVLNSYAVFGEAYYDFSNTLKLTGGLRWTDDMKHFIDIPSELLVKGYGYPVSGIVNQQWDELTGRSALNWTPQLDFTDQTLIYGSYSHGYKAGGANPPGATLLQFASSDISTPDHPLTFKPEFIDAFELGSKNTLLGGALTLDGDVFFYNYHDYQISEIVDRTSINLNFNATVKGAELETAWEPIAGLKFTFAGGYEDTRIGDGQSAIDLMDRTAGNPNWMVVKPFATQASNCILPTYVVAAFMHEYDGDGSFGSNYDGATANGLSGACTNAYNAHLDPLTGLPYTPYPTQAVNGPLPDTTSGTYPGFNPLTAPNNGEGFSKNLAGNQLPNAPHFTTSLSAEYSIPVSDDWAATLHSDFYWQSQSWARVFNDNPYDKLHGYSNVNLSLILSSDNGWQVMAYVKNVFNVTAITGTFLNSDDSGLTTNVFLTDPRLFGVRVTKQLDDNDGFWGSDYSGAEFFSGLFSDTDGGKPTLWLEMGGGLQQLDLPEVQFAPPFVLATPRPKPETVSPLDIGRPPRLGFDEDAKITFQPDDSDWIVSASIRYGRSASDQHLHQQSYPTKGIPAVQFASHPPPSSIPVVPRRALQFIDVQKKTSESHSIIDFQAGKDVGLGLFDTGGSSILNLGVRFAQFESKTNGAFKSDPDAHPTYVYYSVIKFHAGPYGGAIYHSNSAQMRAKRSFHGVGPAISWNNSTPVAGNSQGATFDVDWGVNAGVLFGRQRAQVQHQTTSLYHQGAYGYHNYRMTEYRHTPPNQNRSRMVAVPNIGGFAGISMKYNNAKISFGYRADEFFGAMDGGIDSYKSENRGFFGPFANISIGIGG